jgi:hypothetical protein
MQAKKKKGKRLELYLVDGDSTGAIEVDIVNSNFKLVSLPNEKIKDYHKDDVGRGFYLLVQQNSNVDKPFSVYVGESKNVLTRTVQHQADTNKEFERIILAYTSDDALNTNLTQYIEEKLIKFCDEHPLVNCTNKNKGQASKLKRKDEDTCEELLEQFALVLSALGYYFIQDWELEPHELKARYASMPEHIQDIAVEQPPAERVSNTMNSSTNFDFSQFPTFYYHFPTKKFPHRTAEWVARMEVRGNKNYVLLEGSSVEADDQYRHPERTLDRFFKSKKIHFNLKEHALYCEKSKHYRTNQDLQYESPASCLDPINGVWINTWKVWKTADGKETLEQVNLRLGSPLSKG